MEKLIKTNNEIQKFKRNRKLFSENLVLIVEKLTIELKLSGNKVFPKIKRAQENIQLVGSEFS